MKCAYCGKEARGTREHIISSAILDLFPECYITQLSHPYIGRECLIFQAISVAQLVY